MIGKTRAMSNDTDEAGLTAEQRAQSQASHGEPDTVDTPEAPEENWANARRGVFDRARTDEISPRLDIDVLEWLRGRGPGYQTEINRIPRERMEAEAATQ
jgi:uncharacterized protein (DUF4415 family)